MHMKTVFRWLVVFLVVALLAGCVADFPIKFPFVSDSPSGMFEETVVTLSSLEQVADYPLYVMRYYGAYDEDSPLGDDSSRLFYQEDAPAWACSLFAALGDLDNTLYGRNFDWEYSPALLLFTDPPDGYASVSMVDIAYLGFRTPDEARELATLPLEERMSLMRAPFWPFDGMNEHGLAVGMAAVPDTALPSDPTKPTIGSLGLIREVLDHARDVDEALALMREYNVDMEGGPNIHYLIADAGGRAALVEFYAGEMVVFPNTSPWHTATNFYLSSVADDSPQGQCYRYDALDRQLADAQGRMTASQAMALLSDVAQSGTQWSVVYRMTAREIDVVMGGEYDNVYTISFEEMME